MSSAWVAVHCDPQAFPIPYIEDRIDNHILMTNTPTYILYHGKATGTSKVGKQIWPRPGAACPNTSGKGFNLTWEYVPLGDGVTVMLPYDQVLVHGVPPDEES